MNENIQTKENFVISEQQPLIRIRNLNKEFKITSARIGEKPQILHALSNVNLDIYEGETLGVIGESGCGKSTLGRILVRLHKPTTGSVEYHGKNIFETNNDERKLLTKDIQMVFQDPYSSLDPRMTCEDLIAEPLLIHKIITNKKTRKERVLQLMQEVGLDIQHMNRYPHEFSGGQRQRISLARALALQPRIIVCDEPVSALDVSIQAQMLNLLERLQQKYNLTYIFISHDLAVIRQVSDRIAIMYLGRVMEICKASEIYENPLHPYTDALLSAIPPSSPFEQKTRIVLKGEVPSPIGNQIGCPLASRCPNCMKKCTTKIPEMKHIDADHYVACFLYQ